MATSGRGSAVAIMVCGLLGARALAQPRHRHHLAPEVLDAGAPGDSGVTPEDREISRSVDRPLALALGALPPNPYAPSLLPRNPYGEDEARASGFAMSFDQRRYNTLPERALLEALRTAAFSVVRTVGNTSVNFHLRLSATLDGGFKPAEARHPEHYRAEIAAFRINQLLGLERVPPAVFRRVHEAELPGSRAAGVHFDRGGAARGAMIYWVPVLRHVSIEGGVAAARWQAMLRHDGVILDAERQRAEEISTMLAFDYIIGNWDRWHGTNTLCDGAGHMVYRDNNAGFQEPLHSARRGDMWQWLSRSERFSRSLITHARALTHASIEQSVAPDADGPRPLLSSAQIRGVLSRRDELIAYVNSLVGAYGESTVFAFP